MVLHPPVRAAILVAALCEIAAAAVVDRIAVVVGNDVITQGEVIEETRVTQFLNGDRLDLGPTARRAAAERLVDQQLIRNEMKIGQYPEPKAPDVDSVIADIRAQRFGGSEPAMQASLQVYGLTQAELKSHLQWQLAAIWFTNSRFHGPSALTPKQPTVEKQLDAWLKDKRAAIHIRFFPEAFQ